MPEFKSTYSQAFEFDSDGLGNMVSKISSETVNPDKSIGDDLNYSFSYVYDENYAHRLVNVGDRYYKYDSNGNVTAEQDGKFDGEEPVTYHRITQEAENVFSTDYGWGLLKESKSSGRTSTSTKYRRMYTWDERNQLISSVDSNYSVSYVYGQDGQRSNKYTESSETLYFNNMWTLHTDSGNVVDGGQYAKNIYLGDTRIVTKLKGAKETTTHEETYKQYFYHSDHLGSATLITDYKGDEYQRIEYTPYGETWVEKTQNTGLEYLPYKFTGKEMDEETGLYYYGARYLDPKYSRWISVDPALGEYVPGAGKSNEADKLPGMGGLFNSINLSLFHYAGNNPVRYVDPDGNSAKSALKLIAKHKDTIMKMAERFDVDPVGIASVIFQEKYHGIFADIKDLGTYILDGGVKDDTKPTRSYGLAEMQLQLAAELIGKDINEPGVPEEVFRLLQYDTISIAFIAANIKRNEIILGKKLYGHNAAIAHNMGAKGYIDFFLGKREISNVASRSVNYQEAIRNALKGVVNDKKDRE